MTKETVQRIGIGIASPIIVAIILSFTTAFGETVSKDELKEAEESVIKYVDDEMSEHERLQSIQIENLKTKVKETHEMVTFLYKNAIEANN